MHSTNYFNAFIEIAEDCSATRGEIPPVKGDKKTVANLQFAMVHKHPYEFTSDEVIFSVFAIRKEIPAAEWAEQRELFFSKGQPCLRASPLTKSYGWGIHSNAEGKIAMFGVESDEYQRLVADDSVVKTKAMRSKRA
ncbi:MAG: DUF6157 family protein [Caldilineaceae bacterium]